MLWCLDSSIKVIAGVILLSPIIFFFCRPDWDHMKVSDEYFQTVIFRSNNFVLLSLLCTELFGILVFFFTFNAIQN